MQGAVVIGDLVASRKAADRAALHAELVTALAAANEACDPAEPLAPTVGDEFQGVFHTLVDAVRATLVVRATMEPRHDVRFGVGVGHVVQLGNARPGAALQDGPGWWAARDAIDWVKQLGTQRGGPRTIRTWVGADDAPDASGTTTRQLPFAVQVPRDPEIRALNAFLVTRDQLVSTMDDRDRRILRALLRGRQVTDIAAEEGITASAVSQRSHRSGAAALAFAHRTLR